MNEKSFIGALFSRANLGRLCFVGSAIIFTVGLWLALVVYIDSGPFCMFLCVMPTSLALFYVGHLLD